MKLVRVFLIILAVMSLIINGMAALTSYEDQENDYPEGINEQLYSQDGQIIHGRFLLQKKIKTRHSDMKCNKYPRICRAKGSPGPHCCKKKCVNVLNDRLNCGACGKKCKFNQICCSGKCVNPSFDRRHCGACNNRCSSGGLCAFGLCNYA